MVLRILLLISIILQVGATVVAIRLTRVTRYNSAWLLFTAAFIAMSILRCGEYVQVVWNKELRVPPDFFVWIGVITSLCFAIGVFYVGKIFNYIKRLNYQRQLTERRILTTVLRTEEKERMRFSKELHDGLGPLLSSAKMSLSALDVSHQTPTDEELIRNTSYVIDEAIRSLREISNNLSPHTLNAFGLARAINNFINKSQASKTIKIRFDTNMKTERFDTNVEVILYRVICELLNNSIKHSKCTEIALSMYYNDDTLSISYRDNGKGFDPGAVMDVGMGLSNISSRINSLNGHIDIISSKGQGMRAEINVNVSMKNGKKGKI